jgi:hypothetical protein
MVIIAKNTNVINNEKTLLMVSRNVNRWIWPNFDEIFLQWPMYVYADSILNHFKKLVY